LIHFFKEIPALDPLVRTIPFLPGEELVVSVSLVVTVMSDIESPPAMDNMSLASEDCWLGEVPTERHHTPTSDSMDDIDGSVLSKPMILAAIQSPSLPPPSPLPLRTTTTSTSSTATILTSLRDYTHFFKRGRKEEKVGGEKKRKYLCEGWTSSSCGERNVILHGLHCHYYYKLALF